MTDSFHSSSVLRRPSGICLPLILRNAYGLGTEAGDKKKNAQDNPPAATVVPSPPPPTTTTTPQQHHTVESFARALHQTTAALQQIQRQIHRGEEVYYEETVTGTGNANIFRGWEGFVDGRITDSNDSSSSLLLSSSSTSASLSLTGNGIMSNARRMPPEFRWFSSSAAASTSSSSAATTLAVPANSGNYTANFKTNLSMASGSTGGSTISPTAGTTGTNTAAAAAATTTTTINTTTGVALIPVSISHVTIQQAREHAPIWQEPSNNTVLKTTTVIPKPTANETTTTRTQEKLAPPPPPPKPPTSKLLSSSSSSTSSSSSSSPHLPEKFCAESSTAAAAAAATTTPTKVSSDATSMTNVGSPPTSTPFTDISMEITVTSTGDNNHVGHGASNNNNDDENQGDAMTKGNKHHKQLQQQQQQQQEPQQPQTINDHLPRIARNRPGDEQRSKTQANGENLRNINDDKRDIAITADTSAGAKEKESLKGGADEIPPSPVALLSKIDKANHKDNSTHDVCPQEGKKRSDQVPVTNAMSKEGKVMDEAEKNTVSRLNQTDSKRKLTCDGIDSRKANRKRPKS